MGEDVTDLKRKIFGLTNRVDDKEKTLPEFKANIAGRTLGVETRLEIRENTKERTLSNIDKKINKNTSKIGNLTNIDNVKRRLEDDIAEANKKNRHKHQYPETNNE